MHGVYRLDDGTHGYISQNCLSQLRHFCIFVSLQNLAHVQLENWNVAKWMDYLTQQFHNSINQFSACFYPDDLRFMANVIQKRKVKRIPILIDFPNTKWFRQVWKHAKSLLWWGLNFGPIVSACKKCWPSKPLGYRTDATDYVLVALVLIV